MRVLHVHSGNVFGGIERMMQALAPASAGTAPVHSHFALCFEGIVSDTLSACGAQVYQLGAVRARRLDEVRRARRVLRGLFAEQRWDLAIVHSAWSQAIFGPAVLKSGTPLVRWLHAPQPGPLWLETWAGRAQPALVLCNSRYTMENGGARFGAGPLAVQYPPLPTAAMTRSRRTVRAELGSDPNVVVVILASRLEAGKGHAVFLDALSKIDSPRWEAWIAGGVQHPAERSYLDDLRKQAAAAGISGRVRFLGQRADVPDLLAAADIYCQPNAAPDSFGLSFVEALAAGLPVVTTRLGAAREIVDDSCGVLVDPGAIDTLAEVLGALIEADDERGRMSAAARSRSREFSDLAESTARLAAQLARATARTLALT